MKKALIVYYSHSGNTRKIATHIAQQLSGDLLELQPSNPYPQAYHAVLERAKKEIQEGYLPPLQNSMPNLSDYDVIFVGTPNWWGTMAPPLATFLKQNNFSGKKVAVFCTHGGGGLNRVEKDAKKYGASAEFLPSFEIAGTGGSRGASAVDTWLKRLHL